MHQGLEIGSDRFEIRDASRARGRVLAVDDEPVARQQIAFQLAALGHEVRTAASVSEAREILEQAEPGTFDCLVTDIWMPGQSGLDLLMWLRNYDDSLATIVTSKAADKRLLTVTLRGGATDFIEKPVFKEELDEALQRSISSTRRRRNHAATRLAVKEAGIVQRRMNNLALSGELPLPLTICYHPYHDAGGDSVSFFSSDPSQLLIVVGDVSGHDLKSAFISAWFQGMLRGMTSRNVPIDVVLESFNEFLLHEWTSPYDGANDPVPDLVSLSVCAAAIDLTARSVSLLNGGFPLANRIDPDGRPSACGESGGYALGWFAPNPIEAASVPLGTADRLVIWTDGLEEFANQLQISCWSLAFRILLAKAEGRDPAWLAEAPDDILIVVAGSANHAGPDLFPVLAEAYSKADIASVDEFQARWRRSLAFALPDLHEDRLAEILLCTREAVLNGLLHGCSSSFDQCALSMVLDRTQNLLRIDVSDPGPGHCFEPLSPLRFEDEALPQDTNLPLDDAANQVAPDGHLGLLLIHGLPERVEQDAGGSAIHMFFAL